MSTYAVTEIRIWRYSAKNPFDCRVKLEHDDTALIVKIPPDALNKIINIIADQVLEATRGVANDMTRAAMEHTAIEHQPE